jgi:hypothetical protein
MLHISVNELLLWMKDSASALECGEAIAIALREQMRKGCRSLSSKHRSSTTTLKHNHTNGHFTETYLVASLPLIHSSD